MKKPRNGNPVRLGHWLRDSLFLVFIPSAITSAQAVSSDHAVSLAGDTSGLPPLCSAAGAVAAINSWFRAVETGDTLLIAASVSRRFRWVSVSPFARSESLFTTSLRTDLETYAKRRARARERLVLRSVTFAGWRNDALNFGPIHFVRSADDLGAVPLQGIGKGAYACGEGLSR